METELSTFYHWHFFQLQPSCIHSKSWIRWIQKSADDFEFSAERLSENAKSIKITLFAELLTVISPIYVQSLLNLSIKTLKHTIFSTKMPHWHQILVIFMIYALLSRNFAVRIYALFPQIFGDWKVESADFFTFRMYGSAQDLWILYHLQNILFSEIKFWKIGNTPNPNIGWLWMYPCIDYMDFLFHICTGRQCRHI